MPTWFAPCWEIWSNKGKWMRFLFWAYDSLNSSLENCGYSTHHLSWFKTLPWKSARLLRRWSRSPLQRGGPDKGMKLHSFFQKRRATSPRSSLHFHGNETWKALQLWNNDLLWYLWFGSDSSHKVTRTWADSEQEALQGPCVSFLLSPYIPLHLAHRCYVPRFRMLLPSPLRLPVDLIGRAEITYWNVRLQWVRMSDPRIHIKNTQKMSLTQLCSAVGCGCGLPFFPSIVRVRHFFFTAKIALITFSL